MKTVRRRFEDLLWAAPAPQEATAAALLDSLVTEDGGKTRFWRDIDYTLPNRASWPAAAHLGRLQTILRGMGRERLAADGDYAARVLGGLSFWLERDFVNPNWWYNEIGIPQDLGTLLLLLGERANAAVLSRAEKILERGSMGSNPAITNWTGANLAWGAFNTLRHALFTEDGPLLMQASRRLAAEVTVGATEGIQTDGSFFQHGPRLYAGGYGIAFMSDVSRMIYLLQGTPYAIPREKQNLLLSFLLDGLRPMTHRGTVDWAAIGREISRPEHGRGREIAAALDLLLATAHIPRREELAAFRRLLAEGEWEENTTYFPVAAMLCHTFRGIYVGAKFLTHTTYGAEICNREGELCYNMSYGTHTCIMARGDEYLNVNPVWDYARVPGTTARAETDAELLGHRDWSCRPLPGTHSGGGQKGRRGVIYELAQHDDITATVTDFAFEEGFVCMGAAITDGSSRGGALTTTVDQCHLRGDVTAEGDSVIHNGIRYTPLAGTRLRVEQGTRRGSWHRNSADRPDTPVSAELLTVTILHEGEGPHGYAYMISAAHTPPPAVEVLRNEGEVQAIRLPDGSVLAVFHAPCTLTAEGFTHTGKAGEILC